MITNGQTEAVNRRTDNITAKREREKRQKYLQNTIYKTKNRATRTPLKAWVNSDATEELRRCQSIVLNNMLS